MLLLTICLAVWLDLFSLFKCGIEYFGVASGLRLGGFELWEKAKANAEEKKC